MNMMNEKFSKKEINHLAWRWIRLSQIAWSYNKMMSPGYFGATYPYLKKIYKDDPEGLKQSIETSNNFFNSTPHTSNIIVGMTIGMEQMQGKSVLPAIDGLKTGLMGPFAGIGDTIFGVIIPTIFGAIAAYMAINGNPFGIIMWFTINVLILFLRVKFTQVGYESGEKLITTYADRLNKFTKSATILGLVVIGGLMSTIININLNDALLIGEVPIDLQAMSDQILPSLMPLLLTMFSYYLLGLKRMTSTKLIFLIMLLGIAFSILGILI